MSTAAPLGSAPRPRAPDHFPRWFLAGAGALMLFSLAAVALVRLTGNGPDQKLAPGKIERPLRFEDRANGDVAVVDARSGELVSLLRGEQGFVRGAVRALARERRARDIGPEAPFQLIARQDGGLTLYDPATGKRVDLESFGPANAGAFATLLGEGQR
jgi:putative photosynthetic complex assembly protein